MEPSNYPREEPPKPPAAPKQVPHWISALVVVVFAGGCFWLTLPTEVSRATSMRSAALSDAKQLGRAALMYAEDVDDRLPHADSWMDLVAPYIKNDQTFRAPGKQTDGAYGFAFRAKLSSVLQGSIHEPESVALIYNSSDRRWNANGGLNLLPNPPQYGDKNVICFADGHGRIVAGGDVAVR